MCLQAACARTSALLWCSKSLRTGWMLVTRALYPMIVATHEHSLKLANMTIMCVMPQPALSCNVRDVGVSCAKSCQDFSSVMNKIVGAELNQI